MELINFEDGEKVSDAYVDENGKIVPAVYKGKTPFSAYVMNLLQSNIKNEFNKIKSSLSNNKSTVTGTNITINDSAEARVEEINIRGNSEQATRDGKNLYNYKDIETVADGFIVDEDGWISMTYDNSSGTSSVYKNYFTHNLDLKPSTQYNIIVEIKSVSGTGDLQFVSNYQNQGQSANNLQAFLKDLKSGQIIQRTFMTLSDLSNRSSGIRTFVGFGAGNGGSITFRISVLEDTTITANNFVYEPYGVSPSPDYPSEINSCGDNVNLLDLGEKDEYTNNGFTISWKDNVFKIKGTASSALTIPSGISASTLAENAIYLGNLRAGNYTITKKILNGSIVTPIGTAIYVVNSNYEQVARKPLTSIVDTVFTLTENTDLYLYIFVDSGTAYDDLEIGIKLEKGSKSRPYTECGIGCINETICNKNLYNKNKAIANGPNNQNIFLENIRSLSKDKNYTAYANGKGWLLVREYNSSNELVATYGGNAESNVIANFKPKSDDNYFTMQFFSGGTNIDIANYDFKNIMILEGTYTKSNLPTYIEHKSQTYTIPTQKPFRAIGDYKDTFVKQNGVWYEKHYIKEMVLNGTENWMLSNSGATSWYLKLETGLSVNENIYPLCSHYIGARIAGNVETQGIWVISAGTIRIRYGEEKSVSDFKAWLVEQYNAGTPLIVDFILKTPELIPCTTEQTIKLNEIQALAKTYKNTTHIFSEDEVSPEIEVTYLKDLAIILGGAG